MFARNYGCGGLRWDRYVDSTPTELKEQKSHISASKPRTTHLPAWKTTDIGNLNMRLQIKLLFVSSINFTRNPYTSTSTNLFHTQLTCFVADLMFWGFHTQHIFSNAPHVTKTTHGRRGCFPHVYMFCINKLILHIRRRRDAH